MYSAEQALCAHEFAGRRIPIAFGILHSVDKHRAVHGKVKAVEREQIVYPFEEFALDPLVGVAVHRSARNGGGNDGGQEWMWIGFEEREALALSKWRAPQNGEILVFSPNARIGAAFSTNTPEGDALPTRQEPRAGGGFQKIAAAQHSSLNL